MITTRYKKLKSGKYSAYLDIVSDNKRWYEFLKIHVSQDYSTPSRSGIRPWAAIRPSRWHHQLNGVRCRREFARLLWAIGEAVLGTRLLEIVVCLHVLT